MKIRCGTFNLYQFLKAPYYWYDKKNFYTTEQWLDKKA